MKKMCVLSTMVTVLILVSVGRATTYPVPTALYHFDSNVSDTIDSSTATLYGGADYTTATKKVGAGSLNMTGNGVLSHATVPDGAAINGTNTWAISFWYNRTAESEYSCPISFGDPKFQIMYTKTNWPGKYSIMNSAYGTQYNAFNPAPLEDWQFFAMTADGSTFRAYQGYNGALTETINTTNGAGLLNGDSTLNLGFGYFPHSPYWVYADLDGYMDELAIWNQGLSASQVQAVFDAGTAGTNLVPEPATLALLTLGGLFGIRRRK